LEGEISVYNNNKSPLIKVSAKMDIILKVHTQNTSFSPVWLIFHQNYFMSRDEKQTSMLSKQLSKIYVKYTYLPKRLPNEFLTLKCKNEIGYLGNQPILKIDFKRCIIKRPKFILMEDIFWGDSEVIREKCALGTTNKTYTYAIEFDKNGIQGGIEYGGLWANAQEYLQELIAHPIWYVISTRSSPLLSLAQRLIIIRILSENINPNKLLKNTKQFFLKQQKYRPRGLYLSIPCLRMIVCNRTIARFLHDNLRDFRTKLSRQQSEEEFCCIP
jgi:hypothetical protein